MFELLVVFSIEIEISHDVTWFCLTFYYRSFGETLFLLEERCGKFVGSHVSKLFIRCPALFRFTCPHVCWCPGASALQLRPFQLVEACRLPLHLCSVKDLARVVTLGP